MKEWLEQGKEFWFRERDRLLIFVGILLVGGLMFEAGLIQGSKRVSAPIVLEKPAGDASACSGSTSSRDASATSQERQSGAGQVLGAAAETPGQCRFVGSKNSTLYHVPSCAPAKRIKPENRVCFVSEDDARARGYKPGCLK